jgi:hypothetical protein
MLPAHRREVLGIVEWSPGICNKPKVKCSDCEHRQFIPVSDEVISNHLKGATPSLPQKEYCIGVYPMLLDETCKAKYITGPSATVTRKDGHHPIIFMQCGPIRYRVSDKRQAKKRPFRHRVLVRTTNTSLTEVRDDKSIPIHVVYSTLPSDESRNTMIVGDVLQAVQTGRSPIVLTERREHLSILSDRLSVETSNVFELKGGMGQSFHHRENESGDGSLYLLVGSTNCREG